LIFIDEAVLHVRAGRGGDGCVAFRREKFVPRGGPAGGDGGHGGSVYLRGDRGVNTLFHLRFRSVHEAERGRHGEGSNRTGRSGEDLEIRVPLGTQVFATENQEMIGEIVEDGEVLRVARGGRGGRGNARFATSTHRAPRESQPGRPGEEHRLRLELKLLADVGIVGLPNAGKSTLISVISAAKPKIADYPFTTLTPHLGVVANGPLVEPFVIADLPGLIEGAADGAGLGHQFLRHVERCRVLLHLVDLSTTEGSAEQDLRTVEQELRAFDADLMDRPRMLVGSKIDSASQARQSELQAAAKQRGLRCLEISSVTRAGLEEMLTALRDMLSRGDEK